MTPGELSFGEVKGQAIPWVWVEFRLNYQWWDAVPL